MNGLLLNFWSPVTSAAKWEQYCIPYKATGGSEVKQRKQTQSDVWYPVRRVSPGVHSFLKMQGVGWDQSSASPCPVCLSSSVPNTTALFSENAAED